MKPQPQPPDLDRIIDEQLDSHQQRLCDVITAVSDDPPGMPIEVYRELAGVIRAICKNVVIAEAEARQTRHTRVVAPFLERVMNTVRGALKGAGAFQVPATAPEEWRLEAAVANIATVWWGDMQFYQEDLTRLEALQRSPEEERWVERVKLIEARVEKAVKTLRGEEA